MEIEDEWEKGDEDDNWDPDFEEFDLPKSKGKKTPAKKSVKDDDDFKVDDDFKDLGLFNDDIDDEEDDF